LRETLWWGGDGWGGGGMAVEVGLPGGREGWRWRRGGKATRWEGDAVGRRRGGKATRWEGDAGGRRRGRKATREEGDAVGRRRGGKAACLGLARRQGAQWKAAWRKGDGWRGVPVARRRGYGEGGSADEIASLGLGSCSHAQDQGLGQAGDRGREVVVVVG
jgi:hypothetical protein